MSIQLELNPWHKRQAALLHHFTSESRLRALLPMIVEWINFTESALDERSVLDAVGMAQKNWGATETTAHFSTHAFPAMVEFKETVQRRIAERSYGAYGGLGEDQCARMLQEYGGMTGEDNGDFIWATPEQESAFKVRFKAIYQHAKEISASLFPMRTRTDFSFWGLWSRESASFPSIPRFRVRADVIGESGKKPPVSGIYAPAGDPYGALQFAWPNGLGGELGGMYSFNRIGFNALSAVGRSGLWGDREGLLKFANRSENSGVITLFGEPVSEVDAAPLCVAMESFEAKHCVWHLVEVVDGEHEDHDGTYSGVNEVDARGHKQSVFAGEAVPQSGWWFTPASTGQAARYFEAGAIFPEVQGSPYGATFWQWSPSQSAPAPR